MDTKNVTREVQTESQDWIYVLFGCASCLFLVFGIAGNIVTIVVLRGRSLQNNDISTIICSHCIFNILSLATYISRMFIMSIFHTDPAFRNEQLCGAWITFGHYFVSISCWHQLLLSWFTMLILADKNRPLLHERETFLLISTISFFCGFYVFLVGSFGIRYMSSGGVFIMCFLQKRGVWNITTATVGAMLPGVLLLLVYGHLGLMYYQGRLPSRFSYGVRTLIEELTSLVLATNVTFLLTTFPFHLYSAVVMGPGMDTNFGFLWMHADSYVGIGLVMTNQSVAVTLYYVVGKRFRKEVNRYVKLISSKCCPPKGSVSDLTSNKSKTFVRNSCISHRSEASSLSSMMLPSEIYKNLLESKVKTEETFVESGEHSV